MFEAYSILVSHVIRGIGRVQLWVSDATDLMW